MVTGPTCNYSLSLKLLQTYRMHLIMIGSVVLHEGRCCCRPITCSAPFDVLSRNRMLKRTCSDIQFRLVAVYGQPGDLAPLVTKKGNIAAAAAAPPTPLSPPPLPTQPQ
jgi:hypothetical protein